MPKSAAAPSGRARLCRTAGCLLPYKAGAGLKSDTRDVSLSLQLRGWTEESAFQLTHAL